jgi:hypothetical protein
MMSLVAGLTPGKSLGIHAEDQHMLKLTRRQVQGTTQIKSKLLQTIVHDRK